MALIDSFLKQTVTVRPFIREGNGECIYGREEIRKCRIEQGRNLQTTYLNPDGQIDQVVADAKMFCVGAPIPVRSIVTCEGRDYTVIKCGVKNGFAYDHLEVYLQ